MEKNYLMSLKRNNLNILTPSLNTLAPTYTADPNIYAIKRIMMYDLPNEDVPEVDPMKQYKEDVMTAFQSNNTMDLKYPFFNYNITSKTISCNIPEIQNARSNILEQIELIDNTTKTRIYLQEDSITYKYDKQKGLFVITIPDFNEKTTIFSAFLKSVIDQKLSLVCELLYKPKRI